MQVKFKQLEKDAKRPAYLPLKENVWTYVWQSLYCDNMFLGNQVFGREKDISKSHG